MATAPSKSAYRVLHMLPDLGVGGGQQVVLRTVAGMRPGLFHSAVCYFRPSHDLLPELERAGGASLFLHHRSFWSWPRVLSGLVRYIRKECIDLVHVQGTLLDRLYGEMAAWYCGIPTVRTLHGVCAPGSSIRGWKALKPRSLLKALRRRCVAMLDAFLEKRTVRRFVAVSEAVRDSWLPCLDSRGISLECLEVIHNGVPCAQEDAPLDSAKLDSLRRELGVDGQFPLLINVGRFISGKGQDKLLHMMKKIIPHRPSCGLLLVGDGPERDSVERSARAMQLNDRVLLLGQRLDVRDLLQLSDLFVFPSTYPFEGLSLVVLESMAESKPVVAFRLPIFEKLECAVEGIHFLDDWTADALADAVLELTADPHQLQACGLAARHTVEKEFSVTESVGRMEKVYESVVLSLEK